MFDSIKKFLASKDGNFSVITGLTLIPIVLAVGLSVDYTSASNTRSSMQQALDAAVLEITHDGLAATDAGLNAFYTGNAGSGSAKLAKLPTVIGNYAEIEAEATYAQPTAFMLIAGQPSVSIRVVSKVKVRLKPTSATFKLRMVSGWWDKSVTLLGVKENESIEKPLVRIDYKWNGITSTTPVGTTYLYKYDDNGAISLAAKMECLKQQTVRGVTTTVPSGDRTDCKLTVGDENGVSRDVSEMDKLALQMNIVPALQQGYLNAVNDILSRPTLPLVLRTDNPLYSHHLYAQRPGETKATAFPQGKAIDIYRLIGCGEEISQEWEDGGNFSATDFIYSVTGKCEGKDTIGVALTQ